MDPQGRVKAQLKMTLDGLQMLNKEGKYRDEELQPFSDQLDDIQKKWADHHNRNTNKSQNGEADGAAAAEAETEIRGLIDEGHRLLHMMSKNRAAEALPTAYIPIGEYHSNPENEVMYKQQQHAEG